MDDRMPKSWSEDYYKKNYLVKTMSSKPGI